MNKCSEEVYENGKHVFTIANLSSAEIEEWVQKIAKESKQKVDWHFVGGRAAIRFVGNEGKVLRAIINNLEQLRAKTNYWRFITDNDSSLPLPCGKELEKK